MTKGMVVAPQPEAAETGMDILGDGGHVVDAAVAASLVQTAVDPQIVKNILIKSPGVCLEIFVASSNEPPKPCWNG